MHNIMRMTILQSSHNLLEEPPRLILGHLSSPHDVFEQLSRKILYHHDYIGGCVNYVVANDRKQEVSSVPYSGQRAKVFNNNIQFDDMWMS